jgi:hypothetical protein
MARYLPEAPSDLAALGHLPRPRSRGRKRNWFFLSLGRSPGEMSRNETEGASSLGKMSRNETERATDPLPRILCVLQRSADWGYLPEAPSDLAALGHLPRPKSRGRKRNWFFSLPQLAGGDVEERDRGGSEIGDRWTTDRPINAISTYFVIRSGPTTHSNSKSPSHGLNTPSSRCSRITRRSGREGRRHAP